MADEGYCWDGCSCQGQSPFSRFHCLKCGYCDCCGLRDKGKDSVVRQREQSISNLHTTIAEVYTILSKDPNLLRAIERSRMLLEKLGLK